MRHAQPAVQALWVVGMALHHVVMALALLLHNRWAGLCVQYFWTLLTHQHNLLDEVLRGACHAMLAVCECAAVPTCGASGSLTQCTLPCWNHDVANARPAKSQRQSAKASCMTSCSQKLARAACQPHTLLGSVEQPLAWPYGIHSSIHLSTHGWCCLPACMAGWLVAGLGPSHHQPRPARPAATLHAAGHGHLWRRHQRLLPHLLPGGR